MLNGHKVEEGLEASKNPKRLGFVLDILGWDEPPTDEFIKAMNVKAKKRLRAGKGRDRCEDSKS